MKKIFILLLLFQTSCNLDLPIEDEITGLDAIDDVDIANEALSGVYGALPADYMIFSKLADDFYPNHTISDNRSDYQFYRWDAQEIRFLSNNLWTGYYQTISRANVLLNQIPVISTANSQDQEKLDFIHAQTLCLKAFSYFFLVQLYGPAYSEANREQLSIILKDNIGSESLPRVSLDKAYEEIEEMLLTAIELFPADGLSKFRFSPESAKALLAKTYLNWQKYDSAITICDELLSETLNEETYQRLWSSPALSQEALLVFENETFQYASIVDASANEDEYYTNFEIVYDADDYRPQYNFIEEQFRTLSNQLIDVFYLGKLRQVITERQPRPLPVIRLAELYFVKSEAQLKNSDEDAALATLNQILQIRGADEITYINQPFIEILLNEKQKEFVGEGIRYFDLKRNGFELERVNFNRNEQDLTIAADDYRWLLPIPRNELEQNENARPDNPGW